MASHARFRSMPFCPVTHSYDRTDGLKGPVHRAVGRSLRLRSDQRVCAPCAKMAVWIGVRMIYSLWRLCLPGADVLQGPYQLKYPLGAVFNVTDNFSDRDVDAYLQRRGRTGWVERQIRRLPERRNQCDRHPLQRRFQLLQRVTQLRCRTTRLALVEEAHIGGGRPDQPINLLASHSRYDVTRKVFLEGLQIVHDLFDYFRETRLGRRQIRRRSAPCWSFLVPLADASSYLPTLGTIGLRV